MAEVFARRSPFEGHFSLGTYGRPGTPGVIIRDVSARALFGMVGCGFAQGVVPLGDGLQVQTAPDQALWIGEEGTMPPAFDAAVIVTDLSGSRAILRVEGSAWRLALAAFLPIDLSPQAFPEGSAAATYGLHVGLTLWRPPGVDGVEIAAYRSFAGALWHGVSQAAQEAGYQITQ